MDSLIRKLSGYGVITISREYNYWHVGCMVHSPNYSQTNYVKAVNQKLYYALKDLLVKSKEEYDLLLKKPNYDQGNLLEKSSF